MNNVASVRYTVHRGNLHESTDEEDCLTMAQRGGKIHR